MTMYVKGKRKGIEKPEIFLQIWGRKKKIMILQCQEEKVKQNSSQSLREEEAKTLRGKRLLMIQYLRYKADVIFVQNFTQPDFQAKSLTPQKWVICDIFLRINSVNVLNINDLVIFWL